MTNPSKVALFTERHLRGGDGQPVGAAELAEEFAQVLDGLPTLVRIQLSSAVERLFARDDEAVSREERDFLTHSLVIGLVGAKGCRILSVERRSDELYGKIEIYRLGIDGEPHEYVAILNEQGEIDTTPMAMELLTSESLSALEAARRGGHDLHQALARWRRTEARPRLQAPGH